MSATNNPPAPAQVDEQSHVEKILLADLRGVAQYARSGADQALIDELCQTVAAFRAHSIEMCLAAVVEELGFERVETEAAVATAKGQLQ